MSSAIATVNTIAGTAALLMLIACGSHAGERPTMSQVLADSSDSDWRKVDPHYTLYMSLPAGLVLFELAPEFAPNAIENIRTLTKSDYFSSAAITRSQDNYVVQWGDPLADSDAAVSFGDATAEVTAEFYGDASGLDFVEIDSRDAYADKVGFVRGFPAGRDQAESGRSWLTHCFGMLGIGRDNNPDSGNGSQLYVVTGHAPRHLDRNVVLIGKVLHGIELLTTLPRGTGPLGFYETPEELTEIEWIRFGDDVPADKLLDLEILRTDSDAFSKLVKARRYRAEDWFVDPAGRIGLCNVPVPVRVAAN